MGRTGETNVADTYVSATFLVSTGQRITDDNGSTPEDRIATVFDVIE